MRTDNIDAWLTALYRELDDLIRAGQRVLVHGEELGDRIVGVMGGHPLGRPDRDAH